MESRRGRSRPRSGPGSPPATPCEAPGSTSSQPARDAARRGRAGSGLRALPRPTARARLGSSHPAPLAYEPHVSGAPWLPPQTVRARGRDPAEAGSGRWATPPRPPGHAGPGRGLMGSWGRAGGGPGPMGLWGAWGPLWPWAVGLATALTEWPKPLGCGSGVLLWCGLRMAQGVLEPWVLSLPSSLCHCVCLEPGLGAGTPRATSPGTGKGEARRPPSPTLHRARPGLTVTRGPHPVLWAPH